MFIVKDVHQCNFEYLLAIYRRVGSCPYIRLLHDTVLEQSMFVYKYFTGHLLSLAQKDGPIALTKRSLKDISAALRRYTIKTSSTTVIHQSLFFAFAFWAMTDML